MKLTSKVLLWAVMIYVGSAGFDASAERVVSYARQGTNVTLDLNWTNDNYGTVQWQTSTDDGTTWSDVADATGTSYSFAATDGALYRAVVDGDPSCPSAQIEREIRTVKFTPAVGEIGSDYVAIGISRIDFNGADIVEYGYAGNYTSLARDYRIANRVKVGDGMPDEASFDIRCTGLEPATQYDLRPWFRTADGSVIFGAKVTATTLSGLTWSSEDWTIEKDRISARFKAVGASTVENVKISIGSDRSDLKEMALSTLSDGLYSGGLRRGTVLEPGTEYVVVASATVDGRDIEIEKSVRTWSDYSTFEVDRTSTGVHHNIKWDSKKTLIPLTDGSIHVEYPRMCRVDDNTILFTYHGGASDHWKNSYLRVSHDNGTTWSEPVTIFDCDNSPFGRECWRICNPEMTRLQNGWIILTVVANARKETNKNCKVLAIISKDGGETWGDPIIVGRGRTWEPQVVQLPNGELELLVSSEAAWWEPRQDYIAQEIVSARSTDNGQTWTTFKRASFKDGARDGMPVAVVMQGNQGVLFIEESVNGGVPPTLQHRDLDGEWDTAAWNGADSDNRWRTTMASGGGAPYCIQLPTGEFVMTSHTGQTGSVWQTCRPQVVMADNTGHQFKNLTAPLNGSNPLPMGTGAYYNSLFLKDDTTVWMLITKARYEGDSRKESSIVLLEGKVVGTR